MATIPTMNTTSEKQPARMLGTSSNHRGPFDWGFIGRVADRDESQAARFGFFDL